MTLPLEEQLLTLDELAVLLKLNRRSIYRLMENNTINFGLKVGGHWRYKTSDINAWLEAQKASK
jgi:excisionase family DNA binding protein